MILMILFLLQKYFNCSWRSKPNNIMLVKTSKKFIIINGNRIPTYGYIIKLIDFDFVQTKKKI